MAGNRELPEELTPERSVRCAVVEVPLVPPTDAADFSAAQDLLPWADPYIARLLEKHRLSEALEDSYRFVSEAAAERSMERRRFDAAGSKSHHRFDAQSGGQNWSRDGE